MFSVPFAGCEEQVVRLGGSLVEQHAGVFGHHRHRRQDFVCPALWETHRDSKLQIIPRENRDLEP